MPTFNRAARLRDTLPTVLSQTFVDFELLVQDDGSPDNTEEVIRSFPDPRISYCRNAANLKMPGNLNAAIRRARGEYVVVFHDHDLYEPTVLEEMVAVLDRYPQVGFVHPGILWMDPETGRKRDMVGAWPECMPGQVMANYLLWHWGSPICALFMARRKCYEEVGLYDPACGFISDVEMTIRLCLKYGIGYAAKPLITCLEREKDHVYAKVSWELPRIAVAFRVKHIDSLYGRRPVRWAWARLRLAVRRDVHLLRHLAVCVYYRDEPHVREGCCVISRDCMGITRVAAWLGVVFGRLVLR